MQNHLKATEEFNGKMLELKKVLRPSIYGNEPRDIILYEKLLELQEQITILKEKMATAGAIDKM